MEIIIKGTVDEIADLVLAAQGQQLKEKMMDLLDEKEKAIRQNPSDHTVL